MRREDLWMRRIARECMIDLAWRMEFGGRAIEFPQRAVADMLLDAMYKPGSEFRFGVPTEKLAEKVAAAIGCHKDTARSQMGRTLDLKVISRTVDANNGTRKLWSLSPDQLQKLENITALYPLIDQVVELQIADPDDPLAGAHLVPSQIYHNPRHPTQEIAHASEND